jgi:hypothetical protein
MNIPDRRGMTLMEVAVAGALLVAVMVITFQAITTSAAGQRALDRRQAATREAAGVMERLAALSWDDLTPEQVKKEHLSEEMARTAPGASLRVDLSQPADAGPARRITVEVRWPGGPGRPEAAVRLVAFRYPPASAAKGSP